MQQVAPVQTVLDSLRPDEAFVSIMLGDTEGWTFALRAGRVDVAHIDGGTARAAALVKRLRATVELTAAGTLPEFDVGAAQELYTLTLSGVAKPLEGANSLTVAPSGPLLSIPFALLLTGKADPQALGQAPWLLRRMAVSHVPAPANFVSLRKVAGTSRASSPWFGLGDFQPIPLGLAERSFPTSNCAESARELAGLQRLPFASRELDAARQLLGGSPSDELTGRAYTAAAVQRANLSNYRILHFASHALLPAELKCEDEPAIVTSVPAAAKDASGALLTASEIAALKLDADVVILSACNSGGAGGATGGESLSGLGARVLLRRRPLDAGDALVSQRSDIGVPGGKLAAEGDGLADRRTGGGVAAVAADSDGRDSECHGTSVLLGAVRAHRGGTHLGRRQCRTYRGAEPNPHWRLIRVTTAGAPCQRTQATGGGAVIASSHRPAVAYPPWMKSRVSVMAGLVLTCPDHP